MFNQPSDLDSDFDFKQINSARSGKKADEI